MERSGILGLKNVEVISARLSRNSAKMITFGTFTEAREHQSPSSTRPVLASLCRRSVGVDYDDRKRIRFGLSSAMRLKR
jgi:hypothetical protein